MSKNADHDKQLLLTDILFFIIGLAPFALMVYVSLFGDTTNTVSHAGPGVVDDAFTPFDSIIGFLLLLLWTAVLVTATTRLAKRLQTKT